MVTNLLRIDIQSLMSSFWSQLPLLFWEITIIFGVLSLNSSMISVLQTNYHYYYVAIMWQILANIFVI